MTRAPASILRNRNFLLLWLARCISAAGNTFSFLARAGWMGATIGLRESIYAGGFSSSLALQRWGCAYQKGSQTR